MVNIKNDAFKVLKSRIWFYISQVVEQYKYVIYENIFDEKERYLELTKATSGVYLWDEDEEWGLYFDENELKMIEEAIHQMEADILIYAEGMNYICNEISDEYLLKVKGLDFGRYLILNLVENEREEFKKMFFLKLKNAYVYDDEGDFAVTDTLDFVVTDNIEFWNLIKDKKVDEVLKGIGWMSCQ